MGPDAMILVFWMLSFKPAFSLSSFTFIKRFFSSSSLSAIRVVSCAYLRLLIFLLEVLIPACASPSPAFLMMYSVSRMTIYSLDILLSRVGTSLLLHVQFKLLLLDLHTDFSGGRSGGLRFLSLSEFSIVCCDPHSQRLWHSQYSISRYFSRTLAFLVIQWMLAIWSLVSLPFLKPAWTSGSSWFTCYWSLAWRILSITLLACEMSAIVR